MVHLSYLTCTFFNLEQNDNLFGYQVSHEIIVHCIAFLHLVLISVRLF